MSSLVGQGPPSHRGHQGGQPHLSIAHVPPQGRDCHAQNQASSWKNTLPDLMKQMRPEEDTTVDGREQDWRTRRRIAVRQGHSHSDLCVRSSVPGQPPHLSLPVVHRPLTAWVE